MTTWDDLTAGIATTASAASKFKNEYDSLLATVQERNATIDEQGAEIDSLQEQLALTTASLNEANKANATLVTQKTALEAANVTLTTQVRQLRATVASLSARIVELENQIGLGNRCELPVWKTSVPRGVDWTMPGNGNVRVLNEVWNTKGEAGPQTISVCSPSSWKVDASHPAVGTPADREGAVKSYPCTQVLFAKPALSTITSLTSRWAHEAPALGEWNACYDIWLGGLGSASTAEVMIWTDHRYPGPIPPSNAVKVANFEIGGQAFRAWTRKNSNGGDYIALVGVTKRPNGAVDILAVFKQLATLGWIKMTDKLAAVNYGIEISSTKFTPQVFRLNEFRLEHNGTKIV